MPDTDLAPPTYDRRTIALHWLTAGLVVTLWCLGQTIDWFPKGSPRVSARSVHILLGATLAIVIARRVAWRATDGRRLPPADGGWIGHVAKASHHLLYALVVATVALGFLNAFARGDSLFGIVALPQLGGGDKALRGSIGNLHGLFANALLITAAVHAAAAVGHLVVRRDDVMRRMLPSLRARRL